MSLVIGIIIGSFTAMILIVIIVLKVRTGVDIAEYKQVSWKHLLLNIDTLNICIVLGGNAALSIFIAFRC